MSKTFTVLVVEDETLIRMSVSDYLQDEGYKTLEAADGNEARTILQVHGVDLLLTDVRTDGHRDGIDLALWARANVPDMPVIIMSGGAGADVQNELGPGQRFLMKPVNYAAMAKLIGELLSKAPS